LSKRPKVAAQTAKEAAPEDAAISTTLD